MFTREEILTAVANRLRKFNYGNPAELLDGLTVEDHEIIGTVVSALNDLESVKYPETIISIEI